MKAISLWQPWASAMALGLKTIETRHWSTNVRGEVAIHAAKKWTLEHRKLAIDFRMRFGRIECDELIDPPLGAIVAVGTLVGVHWTASLRNVITPLERDLGNYGDNRFGWRFKNIRQLVEPIPWKGGQGFFNVPDEVASAPWVLR